MDVVVVRPMNHLGAGQAPDFVVPAFARQIQAIRRGEVPPGAKPYFEIPVFNWFAGRLSAIYQRQYIDSAQQLFPDATRLRREQVEAMLEAAGIAVADAPLVNDSILLASPVSALTELGAFRQGLFHVQDPASTLVTKYAAVPDGSRVADVCAAPGGKAIELSRRASVVFASDLSLARLRRVVENSRRLELTSVFPYVADARRPAIREGAADVVLIDAPCTGTGTFRRHPDARWRMKTSDLAVMAALQREILRAAASIIAPGGLLVYSTCSLETEENDTQVERFLAEHHHWRLDPPPEGAVPAVVLDAGRLRVLPQRHGTDGAFAARLRRIA